MTSTVFNGACADQVGKVDWSRTSLGPRDQWPPSLRLTLATLLRSSAPKLLLWGDDLTLFYNDACLPVMGAVGVNGIGRSYPEVAPDGWTVIREHVSKTFSGCEGVKSDLQIPAKDKLGTTSFYEAHFAPLFGHAGISAVLVDIHDKTSDRLSAYSLERENERLQRLFAEAPVLMAYAVGPDLRLDFVNNAVMRLLDFRPLQGRPLLEAVPELVDEGLDLVLTSVFRTGRPWIGENVGLHFKAEPESSSERRYLDFVYQPVRSDNGDMVGILFVGMDVTEKRSAQVEAERLRHQLLHASRVNAMGTMAMTLAHEINQPLAAATNYLAASRHLLGAGGAQDSLVMEQLSRANGQIVRAGEVIRRIRSVVKSGEANRQPVSLNDALGRVASLLEASGALTIKLTPLIAEDAGFVMADEIQLEQVLINLIRNAAQASHASERREAIFSAKRVDERVQVSIRDFGPGLPPDRMADLFVGLHPGETSGLGIGLSLSRTLIEANGGVLRAENAEGVGAIFTFELASAAVM